MKYFFLFKMQTYLNTCTSKFLARCVFSLNIECMVFSWISIFLFLSFDWIESLKPSAIVSFTLSSLEIGFGGTYHSVAFVFTRFYEFVNIVNNWTSWSVSMTTFKNSKIFLVTHMIFLDFICTHMKCNWIVQYTFIFPSYNITEGT